MQRLALIQKACFAIEAGTEQTLIEHARSRIKAKAEDSPGLARYLAAWGDWQSPF